MWLGWPALVTQLCRSAASSALTLRQLRRVGSRFGVRGVDGRRRIRDEEAREDARERADDPDAGEHDKDRDGAPETGHRVLVPYPTVVIVVNAHQSASPPVVMLASGERLSSWTMRMVDTVSTMNAARTVIS